MTQEGRRRKSCSRRRRRALFRRAWRGRRDRDEKELEEFIKGEGKVKGSEEQQEEKRGKN
jgi:hypothetical protein